MASLLATLLLGGVLLDGDLRLEGRAGPSLAGQPPNTALAAANLSMQTGEGELRFRAGIAPQATAADSGGGVIQRFFSRGHAALELRGHEVWRLELRQEIGYGWVDLSPLGALPAAAAAEATAFPGAQPPPAARFVLLEELSTSASLENALSRRVRLVGSAAWQVSGGANASSRASLPLSRGPRLAVRLGFQATRLDELEGELTGFDARYSNGRRASAAAATFRWRRTMARGATLLLAAGPAYGRGEDPTAGTNDSLLPAAQAEALLEPAALGDRRVSIFLRMAAEPVGDQISGDLIERGGVTAGVGWALLQELKLDVHATGSLALSSGQSGISGTVRGDRYAQGELRLTWALARKYQAFAGGRGAWQSRPLGGLPPTQWGIFAGVTFQPFRR